MQHSRSLAQQTHWLGGQKETFGPKQERKQERKKARLRESGFSGREQCILEEENLLASLKAACYKGMDVSPVTPQNKQTCYVMSP